MLCFIERRLLLGGESDIDEASRFDASLTSHPSPRDAVR
jgi:hypothetical protein